MEKGVEKAFLVSYVIVLACGPSTWDMDEEDWDLGSSLATWLVRGQPGLHKTPSEKKMKSPNK